jgi:carnitine O-acetyltransferase
MLVRSRPSHARGPSMLRALSTRIGPELRLVAPDAQPSAAAGQATVRCELPTDWAFADPDAPLYAHMATLPRLPVPDLEPTLALYLHSIRPFLSEEEFEVSKAKIERFGAAGGLGERLHAQLVEHEAQVQGATAAVGGSSWLAEWWDNVAYFDYRASVAFYVSYFYHFSDDSACRDGPSRAASLITGFSELCREVSSGTLAPEATRAGKLCSNGYKFLFHSARVPGAMKDAVQCYDPSLYSGEVVVARKNQLYSLDVTGLDTAAIEVALRAIVSDAGEAMVSGVPSLTATDRDAWYAARTELLSDATNASALEKVRKVVVHATCLPELPGVEAVLVTREAETHAAGAAWLIALQVERAMFMVCLDDGSPTDSTSVGRTALNAGFNRWYDKTLQFIVYENGTAVFVGEHAKSDGSPTARLCDELLTRLASGSVAHGVPAIPGAPRSAQPQSCFEKLQLTPGSPAVQAAISQAEAYVEEEWAVHRWRAVRSERFGKEAIKRWGFSPDAFAQVAMQLAYYRHTGAPCGTYESINTRGFLHGRTEVARSASVDALAFSRAMSGGGDDASKLELLRAAANAHVKYLGVAGKAEGCDRLLFGLKMMMDEDELASEDAAMYADPVFAESGTWKMSTSHLVSGVPPRPVRAPPDWRLACCSGLPLPAARAGRAGKGSGGGSDALSIGCSLAAEYFDGWGYGEVTPDGFGCSYTVKADTVQFNVVSKGLDSEGLAQQLLGALEDMEGLCERTGAKGAPRAKM